MTFRLYKLFLLCLFIFCTNTSEPEHFVSFGFNSSDMNAKAIVNHKYIDTIKLSNINSDSFKFELLDTILGSKLIDSIINWTPTIKDTGIHIIRVRITNKNGIIDTISWNLRVVGFWESGDPVFVHRYDVTVSDKQNLPNGFYIYNRYTEPGLIISPMRFFSPKSIPNTGDDRPGNISVSDDGKWICYVDKSRNRIVVISTYGCNKTIVPVTGTDLGFPTIAGFYRLSPFGTEIYYLANPFTLRSVKVFVTDSVLSFSNDRVLAQLYEPFKFNTDDFIQLSVVKDQIFGGIDPIVNNVEIYRTGFITIPDYGRGTASNQNIYKWNDSISFESYGCGHTQSHNGQYCLSNAGNIGDLTYTPRYHNGFYITSFRRDTDTPISLQNDFIAKFSISINWCPVEYQQYNSMQVVDFWGWYFSNNDDFVVGRQMGSLNQNGIWIVHWPSNTWYRLTDKELNIVTLQPAIYFSKDSLTAIDYNLFCEDNSTLDPPPYDPNQDWFNPHYKVVYPNGGEHLKSGQKATIMISSSRSGSVQLYFSIDGGRTLNTFPDLNRTINPINEQQLICTFPDSIDLGDDTMKSTVSTNCLIIMKDYSNPNYFDQSDSTFSIGP